MNFDWFKQQFELWIERREQRRKCEACEVLKEQLFIANNDKTKLLEQIIELTNPTVAPVVEREDYKPIMPRIVPWHVKKQMLETEARAEAELIRKKVLENKEIQNTDLEDEVLKLANEKLPEVNNG